MGSKTLKDPYTKLVDSVRQDIGYATPFYLQDLARVATCTEGVVLTKGKNLESYADDLVKSGTFGLLKNDEHNKVYVLIRPNVKGRRVCYDVSAENVVR